MQSIWHHRGGLTRTLGKLEQGQVTIGFLGGSITDGRPGHNWPESVMAWLIETFPACRFTVENAAIGATGSALAVFRAKRDIVERNCDLVFVEYAVNDSGIMTEQRMRSREGLVRKLLNKEGCEIVFVYTFDQRQYVEMAQDGLPSTVSEFEQIAEHYRIGSVWMGLYALEDVRKGRMRWEEWLPDGLHPTSRGSFSYAQSVIQFLEKELLGCPNVELIPSGSHLPQPLNENHWGEASILPFSEVRWEGPWSIKRSTNLVWMDQILSTAAVGAKLHFEFEGRGVAFGLEYGKPSADMRYSLDHSEWVTHSFIRPTWLPAGLSMFNLEVVLNNLSPGKHQMSIEVIHGDKPECTGTNFRLALIGIIA